jgi:hypothetical protein
VGICNTVIVNGRSEYNYAESGSLRESKLILDIKDGVK